jgi:hypothetical protein
MEPNPLQKAYDDYNDMERAHNQAKHECAELRVQNHSLLAEVGMMREAIERADADRIRLQAVASTLMGQLRAINAVIADAVSIAIKHGIEAVAAAQPHEKAEIDRAGDEVRQIFEHVVPPENRM